MVAAEVARSAPPVAVAAAAVAAAHVTPLNCDHPTRRARAREAMGHRVQRQKRCAGGVIDIFDLTSEEIIECKLHLCMRHVAPADLSIH